MMATDRQWVGMDPLYMIRRKELVEIKEANTLPSIEC